MLSSKTLRSVSSAYGLNSSQAHGHIIRLWLTATPYIATVTVTTSVDKLSSQFLQRGKEAQGAWLEVLRQQCADLELGLAQEHQHRVRQEHEKVPACMLLT